MEHFGFLSVLPPLLAIIVAVRYKNVIVALFLGSLVGTLMLAGWNPLTGLTMLIKDFIFEQAKGSYNSSLLVMMIFIGGFVGVVTQSGGAKAFAEAAAKWINSRAKAQIALWLAGIAVFFSDSGNPLIIGPSFQPITDKLRISREKLAWLLDCTASPVCILIPFIGWGLYIMGLIKEEYANIGVAASEWDVFVQVIPFQFYALGTLAMIPLVAWMGWEFSSMYKAEKRTLDTGEPFWPDAQLAKATVVVEEKEGRNKATASMMWLPLIVLFVCIFGLLIPHGFPTKPVPGAVLRTALCTGYFLGAVTCIILMVKNKVFTKGEAFKMYMEGCKDVVFILMILVLAWALGAVCKKVGTAAYIVSLAKGNLPATMVPALIFCIGGLISFATGSSWGTFAILMPLAVPMAHGLDAPMLATIGAVLSGGLFGDHCSPISDTTLLSSIGASCDHLDHVRTQIPYALTVALASFIAYVVTGYYNTPAVLGVAVGLVLVFLVIFGKIWGNRLHDYTTEEMEAL